MPIDGYPGYRVSRLGVAQSRWKRCGRRGEMAGIWLPLKPVPNRWGYLSVNLHRGGEKKRRYVHHLVLEAFVGARIPGMVCCHRDGDPANNRLADLRWDTHRSNQDDMARHGTRGRGETASGARLKEPEVVEIRRLVADGASAGDLGVRFGVGTANIQAIARRRTWKHLP